MKRYAEKTKVDANSSRHEIERILTNYGADQFFYGIKEEAAFIAFRAHGRHVKFILPLPNSNADQFRHPARYHRRSRTPQQIRAAYEQDVRQRWRALTLCIKAKLEAIQAGITTFDHEFMAHLVMPDGKTIYEHVQPSITEAYNSGRTIPLLPNF